MQDSLVMLYKNQSCCSEIPELARSLTTTPVRCSSVDTQVSFSWQTADWYGVIHITKLVSYETVTQRLVIQSARTTTAGRILQNRLWQRRFKPTSACWRNSERHGRWYNYNDSADSNNAVRTKVVRRRDFVRAHSPCWNRESNSWLVCCLLPAWHCRNLPADLCQSSNPRASSVRVHRPSYRWDRSRTAGTNPESHVFMSSDLSQRRLCFGRINGSLGLITWALFIDIFATEKRAVHREMQAATMQAIKIKWLPVIKSTK